MSAREELLTCYDMESKNPSECLKGGELLTSLRLYFVVLLCYF